MNRRRVSDPPRANSQYPTSPTATYDRSARASSIFPYSTARPPTNYSEQSWLPPKDAPPVPVRAGTHPETPVTGKSNDGGDETPLYARSDWDQERSPATGTSAYSRSSFAGMTTALPITPFRGNTLGDIEEAEEDDHSARMDQAERNDLWGGADLVASPAPMTASPARGVFENQARSQTPGDPGEHFRASGYGLHYVDSPGELTPASQAYRGTSTIRKSTLPSVLELEHLTGTKAQNPFADGPTPPKTFEQRASRHTVEMRKLGPSSNIGQSPRLMSPAAQQRLGRMSVATARYAASRRNRISALTKNDLTRADGLALTTLPLKGATGMTRSYLTWRIFIVPALCLTAALLLTITLQNNPGAVSRFVSVPAGVFTKSPNGVGAVGLGVNGWCPLTGTNCEPYQGGDFANADGTYTIPGDPRLSSLGDLLTALCVFAWLLAMYTLVTAFLHFYLFFALSLPYTHLLDEALVPAPNGGKGKSQAQIEVDIRIRTERAPFEGYHWVWWAWWGHRRAPLGHLYAVLTSILSVTTFVVVFLFKQSVQDATASQRVSLGVGAYVPLLVFLLTLDPVVAATRWAWNTAEEWQTLLDPPEPSAAAIMLPPEVKPLRHTRNASGQSYFAPRITVANPAFPMTHDSQPLPGVDLDEETRRWLIAYPADEELVHLIADLRTGGENADFILSDDGLLYLRPENAEPALLVPPRGEIRKEILEDAHHEPDENGNSAHCPAAEMLRTIGETFWWHGLENDVNAVLAQCAGCKYDKGGVADVPGMKAGMTPVPYTGVTGWTETKTEGDGGGAVGASAMAAEMAFAMRKAEEQAEDDMLR